MASQKPGKQSSNPKASCTDAKVGTLKQKNSGEYKAICPSIKRSGKISFDSADKLAEEIAALRDKKS
uniref:hypothetical protein n=1 Tax=Citrobacter freundii TaxID=546 RepID=UPI002097C4EA|nr:hypothetical protein [Citrobacter freundii]URZ94094.1 hypothetical protein [Citrobacter freundii]